MVLEDSTNKVPVVLLERIKIKPSTMTTETVFKYLKKKNRPFSGNDVAIALEKEHNKNAVLKSLDKLAEHDKIILKVNGKQKVYCAKQSVKHNLDELKSIERELLEHANEQNRKLQEIENEVKSKEGDLNSMRCGMSLEDAVKEKDRLKESCQKLNVKLDELMENYGKEDLSETKKKVEKDLKLYQKEYTSRKKLCNDILECILESYPGSKKQLYQEIGIDPV